MTADHTQTLWVILQTKQKNLLAKISDLKLMGKFKLEDLKVLYGKSTWGGWKFRTSNLASKTFSFHDGEVATRRGEHYHTIRQIGFQTYFWITILLILGLAITVIEPLRFFSMPQSQIQSNTAAISSQPLVKKQKKTVSKPKTVGLMVKSQTAEIASVKQEIIKPSVPKPSSLVAHQQFLMGRQSFQYGRFKEAYKTLNGGLVMMTSEDQKAAKRMIGDMQYSQCQQYFEQHEERKGIIFCEKAVSTSNNPEAQKFLDIQENNAKTAYLEGYTIQSIDAEQAQEKFMKVMQISRTKSVWRNKASYQIQKYKKNQKSS